MAIARSKAFAGPVSYTHLDVYKRQLFALDKMAEGPFPEHYEPFETPLGTNPLHTNVISNPAARIFKDDAEALGKADKFPYVGTTYRLTEHFHYLSLIHI